MKKIFLITLITLGVSFFGITGSQAQVLNFNDLDVAGDAYTPLASYSSQGFSLNSDVDSYQAFVSPQQSNDLYFGSANLINNFPIGWTTLNSTSGSLFTINSIDLHGIGDASDVIFYAYNLTGTQIANKQVSISDADAWHKFDFDPGFENVHSVKWQQNGQYYSFDNIVLNNVVPEPVSCVLFGVGGLTLAAFRRFRKK